MAKSRMLTWTSAAALLAAIAMPVLAAPDEELLGKAAGYPTGAPRTWFYDEGVRVGSFSRLDEILPHHRLAKPATPRPLPKAVSPPVISYRFEGKQHSLQDFLDRQRITSLLVIKDGQILAEHYQYDRKATHRFVSHSMAKSIVAIAIGMLLAEGRIASLDDPVARYVPELAGSGYGDASIRDILRMSSGVAFKEVYDSQDDSHRFSVLRAQADTITALRAFKTREAPAGTRFHYASIETAVLATVIRAVTGGNISSYVAPRLWQPMGAEADATWIRTKDGLEVGGGSFNATLRDYGRLGILLADDGARDGRQIIPKEYLLDATDWRRQAVAFQPGKATPYFGYGYQYWLFPGQKRRFALLGVYGQSMFVDPELKLVLVITAAARNASVGKETLARERDALWRGLVAMYGTW